MDDPKPGEYCSQTNTLCTPKFKVLHNQCCFETTHEFVYSIVYTVSYIQISYTNIFYICMYSRTHCNSEVPSRMGLSKPSLKPSLLLFRDGFASSALLAPFLVVGLSWVMMVGAVDREVHKNAIEHRAQPSPAQHQKSYRASGVQEFRWGDHREPRIERRRRRRRRPRNTTPPATASTAATAHSQSGHPEPVGTGFDGIKDHGCHREKRQPRKHSTISHRTTPHHNTTYFGHSVASKQSSRNKNAACGTVPYITLHRHRDQEIHRNRNRNCNRPLLPIASCHDRMSRGAY